LGLTYAQKNDETEGSIARPRCKARIHLAGMDGRRKLGLALFCVSCLVMRANGTN